MSRHGFVYFMANANNKVLYVGITNDLQRRVAEHITKVKRGFTSKYNCDKLVYFEEFERIDDAIAREKQIKNWRRAWKNSLVDRDNPEWKDMSESIGVDEELLESVKEFYREIAEQVRNDEKRNVIPCLTRNL